jgi:myo-inositol-1(or 4)-monophosphatase
MRSEMNMDLITIAIEAAHQAGELALRQFRQPQEIRRKGPADPVTATDVAAEELIVRTIREAFPDHQFLGEEGHRAPTDAEYLWIIDPIDGTRNYAHGVPFFCTSIALAQHGHLALGVIYDPTLKETFHAEAGKGAYLNGQRIHVSRKTQLEDAILSMSLVPARQTGNARVAMPMLIRLQPQVESVRIMGSAALHLAYVACGRFDVGFQDSIHAWDVLAGVLLVQEAGGMATDLRGQPLSRSSHDCIVANNADFHSAVLRAAHEALAKRELNRKPRPVHGRN